MRTRRFLLSGAAGLAVSTQFALARSRRGKVPVRATAPDVSSEATLSAVPATTPIGPLDTLARWACVIDYDTGATLLEKAADERMPPSSLTKMMTAYVVFGMLRAGHLSLTQSLPVSEKAWRTQGSKMFVPLGESVTVSDLIEGMVIQSGNDACIVLAEGIAGSEEQFVNLMNQESAKIGLTNTHFANCTGLPNEQQYMSARDVSRVATHLIRDYPEYYHEFSATEFTFNKIKQGNRNVLVDKGLADGLKTGHTDAGGFGLCASSKRDGRRVIMTINGTSSTNERAHEGERLLGWAFANFENVTLFHHGQVVDTMPVYMGETVDVPLVGVRDIVLTLPRGWQQRSRLSIEYRSPAIAPVSSGETLGALVLQNQGMPDIRLDLVAARSVPRLGLVGRALARLGHGPKPDPHG